MSAVATEPPTVRPDDFLGIDHMLSDEERDIRDMVRAFVRDRVLPYVGDWFEQATLPREIATELGKLNVLGMHLHGYGCAGASATAYGLASMELEAGDTGIRSLVSVQGSLAMYAIYRFGSEEQKQQWLPGMAAGELIGCFGLTEPDAGSDPGAMTHPRPAQRRRLDPPRPEDVDHQRRDRRCRGRLGADRRRRPRLPGPEGHQGIHDPGHPQEDVAACLDHLGAAVRRRASAGRRDAPRRARPARPAVVPERGALRDRLGRRRLRPRLSSRRRSPTARSGSRSASRSPRPRSSSRSSR